MKKEDKKNWLEWVVLVISGGVVLFTFGYLIYEMTQEEQTPPDIVISYGKMEHRDGYYAIPIEAVNNGAKTAEDVRIEISTGEGTSKQTAIVNFPYLAGKSTVMGWATFSVMPTSQSIMVHILGYGTP